MKYFFPLFKSHFEVALKAILRLGRCCTELHYGTLRDVVASFIRYFKNEKETIAEIRPAVVPGIVTGDAPVSYWPIFPLPSSLCKS